MAGEIGADINFDYGPGTYDFPAPAAGLDGLAGYRGTLVLTFDGTEAGQPQQWSKTYVMTTTKEPAQRELTVAATGDGAESEALYRAEMNGVAYESVAGEPCTAGAIYGPDSLALRWEPAGFLFGVRHAAESGSETVNGVDANHYTFDQRAFGPLPPADTTGEMWVAADGGYLVKYQASTVGTAEYFGEGIDGTLTSGYELTEINAPLAIELPADCPSGIFELGVLPDATELVRSSDLMSYTTAKSVEEVGAFYESELSGLGWQPLSDAAELENGTAQDFTRGDKRLSLIITADAGTTTVRIAVAPIQAEPTPS